MRLLIQFPTIILACSLIASCTTQTVSDPKQRLMEEAREFSVVAVTNPKFNPQPGTKFAWFSTLIWSSELVTENNSQGQEIIGILESQLLERGYQVVNNTNDADYIIGAAVADGDSELTHELTQFFRLFPSLGQSRMHHDKSTLYVGVINAEELPLVQDPNANPEVLWRSSIQAYILGEELADDIKHQRFQVFGRKLMASFP